MNRVFSQQIFRCDGIQANVVAFLIPAARHVLPLVIHSRRLRVSPPSILFSRFLTPCRACSLSLSLSSFALFAYFGREWSNHFENQHSEDVPSFRARTHVTARDVKKLLYAPLF